MKSPGFSVDSYERACFMLLMDRNTLLPKAPCPFLSLTTILPLTTMTQWYAVLDEEVVLTRTLP